MILRILLPTNEASLAANQVETSCEKVVAGTREKFYFRHQNLSMLCVLITDPKQTCFVASDVTPVYDVTPA